MERCGYFRPDSDRRRRRRREEPTDKPLDIGGLSVQGLNKGVLDQVDGQQTPEEIANPDKSDESPEKTG